ncbi:MAG: hypothetical protein K8W52_36815 [Deltaproteobacteria bacterium]|nr:hypothetical protein [Deltaproteobacteria bacterium]
MPDGEVRHHRPVDVGFVISSVAALGSLGAATLRWMSPEARRNRALLGAPRVNIADYVEGELVRLVGTVVSGPTLIAPLSGRTGVLYEARIAPRLRPWTALVHEADGSVFVIDDDTGHAAINTSGALFAFGADVLVNDSIGPAEEAMLARHGKPPDGNLRSSERVLSIGALTDWHAIGLARHSCQTGGHCAARHQHRVAAPARQPGAAGKPTPVRT